MIHFLSSILYLRRLFQILADPRMGPDLVQSCTALLVFTAAWMMVPMVVMIGLIINELAFARNRGLPLPEDCACCGFLIAVPGSYLWYLILLSNAWDKIGTLDFSQQLPDVNSRI